ncbi:50S ribosomal protein L10 [Chloroflexota bacterium]
MMPTEKKREIVQQLVELLAKNRIIIATEYRGLSVADMSALRRQLRPLGIEYHVVKNTLTSIAAEKAEKAELSSLLKGPIALAFSYDDVVHPAKALLSYRSSAMTSLGIMGGLIDNQLLTAGEISRIATLPSIEVLRARLLGILQSPISNLQNVLSANLQKFGALLDARIKQLGGMPDAN